jgi:hypothetical protein
MKTLKECAFMLLLGLALYGILQVVSLAMPVPAPAYAVVSVLVTAYWHKVYNWLYTS